MRLLLLILFTCATLLLQAQQINGTIKDGDGVALAGVTVSLVKATDSSTVKLAITKSTGSYGFSGIKDGNYRVLATHTGYRNGWSAKFSFASSELPVPEIRLTKMAGNLGAVIVSAQRPIVEVKADKMILNVEGTINAVGSNALELLRKSPGVLLDKDENISLSGKNGVQVYIDNRPAPLSGPDLANYLKSMQSSQIEAIELITNPSAKYDAAGNAGIINIRLKKNKALGTNGSVDAGWAIGTTAKYTAGASLNYRKKAINIFNNYSFGYGPNEQHVMIKRTVLDSLFDQQATIRDLRRSHNFKLGMDYFFNKKNTVGIMVNGIISDPASVTGSHTLISNSGTGVADRSLVADNNNGMKKHNANINLNYNYADLKGTVFTVNADRGSYDLNSDQLQGNHYYDLSERLLNSVVYHILSPSKIHINSFKSDYEQKFKKGKLSFGVKSARVKTDNDFQRYNVSGAAENLDKDRSNHFIYKENINAGYVNYNRQYKKFMLQGGLRVEHTGSEGISNGLKLSGSSYIPAVNSFERSYTDLFPSVAITFNKDPKKQWSFTYSRRIDRPAYQDLNPFEFKLDEYTSMKGNINLRPQYSNNLGATYIYKYRLNMSFNYSHVKDLFTQIIDTAESSKAFVSKKNLATQDIASFSMSYPYQHKSYSLFTNIGGNYSKYRADFGTGRNVNLNAFGFNIFMQHSLKFAKTWAAELSGFYNAPTVYEGSFKGKSIYNIEGGISKQVMQGRATVKAAVSDLFYSQKFRATSVFAGQKFVFSYREESRQLKLNFNYRFGNNKVKAARQRVSGADDELKRVKQNSGFIGN